MGTVVSFDIRDPRTAAIHQALRDAVYWLHHVDRTYSPYRPDSAVSRLARGELTPARCSPEVREVLALCDDAVRVTDGWFDPLAGGAFDPSGLVKGWSVERACQLLHAAGARSFSVNGGGDIQSYGEPAPGVPWRFGVADPLRRPGALSTVVTGRDLAVATSGTAERGTHIIDPRSGAPVQGPGSVTVTGPRLTLADVYATAAFAMGGAARRWLEDLDGYEGFAVTADGFTWQTSGFPGPGGAPPAVARG
ncbi:FAD:protein FMN transferase [Streptomyces sp. NPDC093085]|uniref:FAD:protein FMN transferase n=1 Tax=Streptomyces sp. NPDC093085 TaxID=3155068 RepID=UPI00341CF24F